MHGGGGAGGGFGGGVGGESKDPWEVSVEEMHPQTAGRRYLLSNIDYITNQISSPNSHQIFIHP